MVILLIYAPSADRSLSVLALSSRFDGQNDSVPTDVLPNLSVLALSSRFDGPTTMRARKAAHSLSVLALSSRFDGRILQWPLPRWPRLSVLALSSRFDGLRCTLSCFVLLLKLAFSTRSVESF